MDLKTYLSEKCQIIDSALDRFLPKSEKYPSVIHEAMRYSVMNGGKRLRPILAIASCEAVGGDYHNVLPAGCAIEFIHAFSLIHDDLPALDNDDLRRGKPTNHKVFGEAMAILAGDGLLAYAFETIACHTKGVPAERVLDVCWRIAAATGMSGMIVGQVVDMISAGKQVDSDTLSFMHRNKTGALITVSCVSGALLGGGTGEQLDALTVYGEKIGLAFQIMDDILDVVGDQGKLGKPVGSDIQNHKSTYPSLYGLDESKGLARRAVDEAATALIGFDEKADPLRSIAGYIIERQS